MFDEHFNILYKAWALQKKPKLYILPATYIYIDAGLFNLSCTTCRSARQVKQSFPKRRNLQGRATQKQRRPVTWQYNNKCRSKKINQKTKKHNTIITLCHFGAALFDYSAGFSSVASMCAHCARKGTRRCFSW